MGLHKSGKSNNWLIIFSINGQVYRKSSKTSDKKLATKIEAKWRHEILSATHLDEKPSITLGELVPLYVESKLKTPSWKTVQNHAAIVQRFFNKDQLLDKITNGQIDDFHRLHKKKSTATIAHYFGFIKGFIRYAQRKNYAVPELEFPELSAPKDREFYLQPEQEAALLAEMAPKLPPTNPMYFCQLDNWHFTMLLLDLACRHTELSAMKWKQVNLDKRTVKLWRPKTETWDTLALADRSYKILLERQNNGSEYIFTDRSGKRPRRYTTAPIKKALAAIGITKETCDLRNAWHLLRHTTATRLVENGVYLADVQKLLGHSSITMTERYAKPLAIKASVRIADTLNKLNSSSEDLGKGLEQ